MVNYMRFNSSGRTRNQTAYTLTSLVSKTKVRFTQFNFGKLNRPIEPDSVCQSTRGVLYLIDTADGYLTIPESTPSSHYPPPVIHLATISAHSPYSRRTDLGPGTPIKKRVMGWDGSDSPECRMPKQFGRAELPLGELVCVCLTPDRIAIWFRGKSAGGSVFLGPMWLYIGGFCPDFEIGCVCASDQVSPGFGFVRSWFGVVVLSVELWALL
ncbi:hypothetical protein AG1IA_03971 [Rhizoctonia solani AG-1 IA]|uniref:Uncharacterized protein n=1 Tax=Thanatephorus cucumeris (strain AG1-IA) TaxID=983506 RepID=L8WYZ5_THACA|nr:hypothetical protein AG1IA_03971 [Rhizoctonia solani AG-1 IA]